MRVEGFYSHSLGFAALSKDNASCFKHHIDLQGKGAVCARRQHSLGNMVHRTAWEPGFAFSEDSGQL